MDSQSFFGTNLNILAITCASLIAIPFLWILYNLFLHPLRHFPGPKSWAASVIPFARNQLRGTDNHSILELHKRYGPVVRIGPNDLSYADPVVYRETLTHRPAGHAEFPKCKTFAITPTNGVLSILFANRDNHTRYRRAFAASFSEKGMQQQQSAIRGFVDKFIDGLNEKGGDAALDMTAWFNWTSFDVIGHLTFGESFGCLEHQRMHPWIEAIFGNVKAIAVIAAMRQLGLGPLISYLVPQKTLEGRIRHAEFSEQKMRARIAMGSNQGDFLDPVLKKYRGKSEEGSLTFDELVSNGSLLVLAGSETTATLLSGTVYQLCCNPLALQRTIAEIRSSFASPDEIDLFSTAKLSYTLAVLNETMRIYPPVPVPVPRESPAGGASINGIAIPGGSTIYISQYVMSRLDNFWAKPEEFHPERFLKEGHEYHVAGTFDNDDHSVFQPFSIGPRNCIGRNLAYAEMRLILTRLLFDFDLELDERSKDWTKGQKAYKLWVKPPLWVKVTPKKV
ncbi:cytochrome P450 [Aulographum hederae CBS 113979]|uniref:Cytochrome P450 n=1 Tax=Aulographum hederae CBS 113979 TaxID=1176131 RepID=A0A6G1HC50_9PEZI|nr:cytochrome P450 [Aulographum hederae CBS 113979]